MGERIFSYVLSLYGYEVEVVRSDCKHQ